MRRGGARLPRAQPRNAATVEAVATKFLLNNAVQTCHRLIAPVEGRQLASPASIQTFMLDVQLSIGTRVKNNFDTLLINEFGTRAPFD